MKYTKVRLITEGGVLLSLSNLFPRPIDLEDKIEDSKNANDLICNLTHFVKSYAHTFTIDRETEDKLRIKVICNMCNNVEYLIIYKN